MHRRRGTSRATTVALVIPVIRALILSRFDPVEGPVIMQCVPRLGDDVMNTFQGIPRFMDMMSHDGLITYNTGNLYTVNYFFTVPVQKARGRREQYLISIAFNVLNDDERWIKKIVEFLRGHEQTLVDLAAKLKKIISGDGTGSTGESKPERVVNMLLEHYDIIFVKDAGALLEGDAIGFKLWVTTGPGIAIQAVLDRARDGATRAHPRSLRDEFILFMLEKVKFVEYQCTMPVKDQDTCPVCMRHYLETAGMVHFFDARDPNPLAGVSALAVHLHPAVQRVEKPLLVMRVDAGQPARVTGGETGQHAPADPPVPGDGTFPRVHASSFIHVFYHQDTRGDFCALINQQDDVPGQPAWTSSAHATEKSHMSSHVKKSKCL